MNILNRFTIGKRLVFVFVLIVLLSIFNLWYNLKNLNVSKEQIDEMYSAFQGIEYLVEADRDAYQSSIAICQLLEENEKANETKRNELLTAIDENRDQILMRFTKFSKMFNFSQDKVLRRNDSTFHTNYKTLSAYTDTIIDLFKRNKTDEIIKIYNNTYAQAFSPMREAMNAFTDYYLKESEDSHTTNTTINGNIKENSVLVFCVIVLVFVFSGISLVRSISIPLDKAVFFTRKISNGDLTGEIVVEGKDETSAVLHSIKYLSNSVIEIVNEIKACAENFFSSSRQISESSQHIATGSNEQAASSEEISSSIEEISASINQNAENAQQTERIANQSVENITSVNEAVQKTIAAMNLIIQKISIVKEIAGKTDLLAINAAIEAARAGEHGKGFAVVAHEVRKLAEHSQKAASEIDTISMDSILVAEKSGELLYKVIPEIQNTARLIQEIAASSTEQNSGIQQINTAIQQFTQIVQQNSAMSEQLASSSEQLTSQASKLVDTISFFKTNQRELEHFSDNELKKEIKRMSEILENRENIRTGDKYTTNVTQSTKTSEKLQQEKKEDEKEKTKGINIKLDSKDEDFMTYS